MTKYQTWLHCLDIPELLEEGFHYSHGNPFSNKRKVVLDNDLYKKMMEDTQSPEFVPTQLLLQHFLDTLQKEHHDARANNQKLMILIFAEGDAPSVLCLPRDDASLRPAPKDSFMLHLGKPLKAKSKNLGKKCPGGLIRADLDKIIDGMCAYAFRFVYWNDTGREHY